MRTNLVTLTYHSRWPWYFGRFGEKHSCFLIVCIPCSRPSWGSQCHAPHRDFRVVITILSSFPSFLLWWGWPLPYLYTLLALFSFVLIALPLLRTNGSSLQIAIAPKILSSFSCVLFFDRLGRTDVQYMNYRCFNCAGKSLAD